MKTELEARSLSRDEAERLTERIRHAAASFVEAKEKLTRFIGEAQEGKAWEALGYASWPAYTAAVFSDTPLMRLSLDERRELVSELSEAGMSTRAIAPIVGVTQQAVSKSLRASAGDNQVVTPPESADDGYPDLLPEADEETGDEPVEVYQPFNRDDETAEPVKITGMDGKQYTRPAPVAPAQPRRKPLTDQFLHAVVELNKAVERIQRLTGDDRFTTNKNEVASRYGSDLERAAQTLETLHAALTHEGDQK